MSEAAAILFWLLVGHAVADFALQTGWIAEYKNRRPSSMSRSGPPRAIWPYVMSAHALIHGGAVALATGYVSLGAAEVVVHWIADFAKCENWTGIHADQAIHLISKIVWAAIAVWVLH